MNDSNFNEIFIVVKELIDSIPRNNKAAGINCSADLNELEQQVNEKLWSARKRGEPKSFIHEVFARPREASSKAYIKRTIRNEISARVRKTQLLCFSNAVENLENPQLKADKISEARVLMRNLMNETKQGNKISPTQGGALGYYMGYEAGIDAVKSIAESANAEVESKTFKKFMEGADLGSSKQKGDKIPPRIKTAMSELRKKLPTILLLIIIGASLFGYATTYTTSSLGPKNQAKKILLTRHLKGATVRQDKILLHLKEGFSGKNFPLHHLTKSRHSKLFLARHLKGHIEPRSRV